jgi:hypothetical protein
MKKLSRWMALGVCLLGLAGAQNPLPWRAPDSQPPMAPDAGNAQRLEMEFRERQFVERANRFAKLWTQFALEYNQRKAIDIKTARAVSKAFHELERGEGWPRQ